MGCVSPPWINCDYELRISTERWATSTTGKPIVSYDDGKSWSVFEPVPNTDLPKAPTLEMVYGVWEKKEN
jgi:hypothetical protein